jgi:ubiquinone/menaquinone biosynthesis C-methylase UbiE
VHVEEARVRGQGFADRIDRRAIAALAEVRHRLERQHGRTLGVVKEYYDLRAPTYDDWYLGRGKYASRDAAAWQRDLAGLTRTLEALPPARTLDVACGTGFLTRHLPGDLTGLDQSARMLEIAQRSAPEATFQQGDGLALPFPDGSFERVFTGHFYGHLDPESRTRFLAEARRVGDELVVVDAAERADHEREEIQQRELPDGSVWPILKRFFTPSSLAEELGGGETVYSGPWFVVVRAPR